MLVSSDVVWETKLKKRSRWKILSGKEAARLEHQYQEYMETGPVDSAVIDLENDYQVSAHRDRFSSLKGTVCHLYQMTHLRRIRLNAICD